jgi:pimeloyl-ACP methyl ester carboxylesterase
MAELVFRSRYVMAGGVKTHYAEAGGDGPVIVAMHGGGAGSSGGAGLGALLSLLSDDYRVIGLDSIGGFGKTDPTGGDVHYGLQSRVDHLASFLDALCLDRVTLMGNSQGAWCVAKYATMRPDRVERLVLLGTGSIVNAMGLKFPPSEGLKLMEGYDGTREGMRRLLEGLVYDKSKITEPLLDMRQAAASRPGAMETFKAMGAANRKLQNDPLLRPIFDLTNSLPRITKIIPSIMIWGENDIFAVPESGRQLEPLLPDVKFHWVPKAGHQVQTDRPDVVAEIVRAFMRAPQREPAVA